MTAQARVEAVIIRAVEDLRNGVTVGTILDALTKSQRADIASLYAWDDFTDHMNAVAKELALENVVQARSAVQRTGPSLATSFGITEPHVVAWANQRAGDLITAIGLGTRLSIREMIVRANTQGTPVDILAGQIRNIIGLHPQWAMAVRNYEDNLRAKGKSQKIIDARVATYRQRLIHKRARMIARTEVVGAANQGRLMAWKAQVAAGLIDPDTAYKRWLTHKDERTCPVCGPTDREEVPFDTLFSVGVQVPPLHPNCRCTAILVVRGQGSS